MAWGFVLIANHNIGEITVIDSVYCVKCKKIIEPNDMFCRACGADQRSPSQRPVLAQDNTVSDNYEAAMVQAVLPTNLKSSHREVSLGWTFLGGCIYFFVKGWWKAGLVSLFLGLLTGGLSWFIIPFFAQSFVDGIEGATVGGDSSSPAECTAALHQLADLRSRGIVSEEEYLAKRADLLRRI